ncbi:midnolin-like [Anabas testudineus]|uniref:Ubiquitin-like domain-containing protein n=1 Tax=Anabas testudineus TaxID=64144 RepID=A0A3Q1JZ66_ANATE|nr:midnolin-like [Anabas testudineus]
MEQQQRGVCSFTPDRGVGCGAGVSTGQSAMRLSITSTTGSPVELMVPRGDTVEGLRTRIAQKLRLQTEKFVLLHNDRKLTGGRLLDFGLTDGSKVTLVPVVEAGLVCPTNRLERTVMDVLESLTEVQISDFLSGRSPLTINLGIGARVMYVQLQLSAQDVKELQQDEDVRVKSSSEHKTGPLKTGAVSLPNSALTWSSTTSPASNTSTPAPNTADSAFNLKDTNSHSSTSVPAVNCHHQSSLHPSCPLSTSSLAAGFPHPSCPVRAAAPVCSPAPTGSSTGPLSPTPASTFTESNIRAPPTAELSKQPGAVIESFVSHSPGVFSGTFSGTLAPCSQNSISHPRHGVAVILHILNDLLKAAYNHQGASPAPQQCHSSTLERVNPLLIAESTNRARSKPLVAQREEHSNKAPGDDSHSLHSSTEENETLHCKLEHLQFLMHQRRLRRRTRRNSRLLQTTHLYQRRHHHP